MAKPLRKATGVREVAPGVFEPIAQTGRDPVTGKYRQVFRRFRGTLQEAKLARAELLAEVKRGRHVGTTATMDELCEEWLRELERKDRSPRTVDEYRRRYRHDIQPTLGSVRVSKVTTKMLTDLYGAHQRRGIAPASVHKIHATVSSMMSQARRWGWRTSNPAEWADPPPIVHEVPLVPTPAEVLRSIEEARRSRRPVRGDEPWDPDTITQYFARMRDRLGLVHIEFKGLRRFMDTYGQELGFSMAQVAMRAGHDPAVAGRHYTGRVSEADRALASALAGLLR